MEKIKTLYELYKNTPKKLKIICDWDEVIQTTEPYALWMAKREVRTEPALRPAPKQPFSEYFNIFWGTGNPPRIKYSPYGSRLSEWCISITKSDYQEDTIEKQIQIKNSPDFYQQTPFLTIAEDLLKLIREDKVERLIFLSAYDKRKFPSFDGRKIEIFHKTFNPVKLPNADKLKNNDFPKMAEMTFDNIEMKLIPFESESKGQSKVDWIKENASDFDIVIDDNPYICKSLISKDVSTLGDGKRILDDAFVVADGLSKGGELIKDKEITVLAPYYPAIENQHHKDVILVKQEVNDLKPEDFDV